MRVDELMSHDVKVCLAGDTLNRAAELMWNHNCGFLPVVPDETSRMLTGVITDRDIAMAAYTQGKTLCAITVSVAMARGVKVCHPSDDITTAEALMRLKQVHRLPVIDDNGAIVGVISLNDIARGTQREAHRNEQISDSGVAATVAAISQPRDKHGSSVEREYIE
jgi:CBS domain-containing protein